MYQEERLKLITDYVNKNKQVSTHKLSEIFKTSLVTIRSDLNILSEKGLLIKTHGGAVTNSYRINDVIPSNIKFKKNVAEKKKIAKLASRYINDGDVISVIGPSGTGKSTLLRCINMLTEPTSGSIIVDGQDITEKGCNCITYPFIDSIPFCYEKNRPALPVCQIS